MPENAFYEFKEAGWALDLPEGHDCSHDNQGGAYFKNSVGCNRQGAFHAHPYFHKVVINPGDWKVVYGSVKEE